MKFGCQLGRFCSKWRTQKLKRKPKFHRSLRDAGTAAQKRLGEEREPIVSRCRSRRRAGVCSLAPITKVQASRLASTGGQRTSGNRLYEVIKVSELEESVSPSFFRSTMIAHSAPLGGPHQSYRGKRGLVKNLSWIYHLVQQKHISLCVHY